MNGLRSNNYFHTILFVVLAIVMLSFVSKKEESHLFSISTTIQLCLDEHNQVVAISPSSIELPICASLVDENHSILDYSSTCNHFSNLVVSEEYTISQEKLLSIKPLLSRTFQRLFFPSNDDGDYITIC